jgi:hypothetical protein
MKRAFVVTLILFGSLASADVCKKGDIKDCAKFLKSKEGTPEFSNSYEQVCGENKTFKCLKRTVRGDVNEEMKYMKEEYPKANLYKVNEGGEDKIFALDKK